MVKMRDSDSEGQEDVCVGVGGGGGGGRACVVVLTDGLTQFLVLKQNYTRPAEQSKLF